MILALFEELLSFWGVLAPKLKIPNNDCFEKVKILRFFLLLFSKMQQLISIIIYYMCLAPFYLATEMRIIKIVCVPLSVPIPLFGV